MATYAIGDLQGCYEPFLRLLDKLHFDPAHDTLWLAGDLVNRGQHSLETLRFVRSLGKSVIAVQGNHDISLLAAFHGLRKPHKSLKTLMDAPDCTELVQWLAQCPLLHVDRQAGYAISHAGIPPQWDITTAEACAREVEQELTAQDPTEWLEHVYSDQPDSWNPDLKKPARHCYILNAFTRMRFCRMDGSLDFEAKGHPLEYIKPNPKKTKLLPWFLYPNRKPLEVTVLFGHWSTLGYYSGDKIIALDTGCVWGGQLSAVRIDTNDSEPQRVECTDYG